MKAKMISGLMMVFILGIVSCSKDATNPVNLSLVVKSSNYVPPAKKLGGITNVKLSDVYLNISKIEFKLDESEFESESESHSNDDSLVSEQELEGPFSLTLMKDSVLQSNNIAAIALPPAAYDKVEFKINKNTTLPLDNPLLNHSIFITGSVNSIPFKFWYDDEENFEIELPDTSVMQIGNETFNLFIDFHINRIVDGFLASVIDQATDGNEDGIIEIGTDDTDGNQEIANAVMNYIKHSCDLDDDNSNENDDSNSSDNNHFDDNGHSN